MANLSAKSSMNIASTELIIKTTEEVKAFDVLAAAVYASLGTVASGRCAVVVAVTVTVTALTWLSGGMSVICGKWPSISVLKAVTVSIQYSLTVDVVEVGVGVLPTTASNPTVPNRKMAFSNLAISLLRVISPLR